MPTRKSYNLVSGKGARRVEQSMSKGASIGAWAYIVPTGQTIRKTSATASNSSGRSALRFVCFMERYPLLAPLAYLFSRTKFARYRVFDILFMIPFMTPPYIASMGWILFMQKKGLLQQLIPATAGCEKIFFTLGGLVLVMSLHVFPFMLTMLKNAMLNIPSSLEEAGAVFGAGFGARMRKIFLPLLSGNYAIGALLVFVKTLSEYGTPSTLGKRIGFEVFTTEIHRHATVAPIDFGSSATLSSVLVGICLCMWMLKITLPRAKAIIWSAARVPAA